jgi:hypothetical protein
MSQQQPEDETRVNVESYRKIVVAYEALHAEISKLIEANNGGTEHMSPADLKRYREMARRRDELFNEMRWMEQQLLDNDESV